MDNYLHCQYRKKTENGLVCNLAQTVVKSSHPELFVINDDICKRCYETKEIPDTQKINTVIGEILYKAAEQVMNTVEDEGAITNAQKLIAHLNDIKPKCCGRKRAKVERIIGKIR